MRNANSRARFLRDLLKELQVRQYLASQCIERAEQEVARLKAAERILSGRMGELRVKLARVTVTA